MQTSPIVANQSAVASSKPCPRLSSGIARRSAIAFASLALGVVIAHVGARRPTVNAPIAAAAPVIGTASTSPTVRPSSLLVDVLDRDLIASATALSATAAALEQSEGDCVEQLCGPVWRARTHPFVPNLADASPDNLALLEREARAGNEDALEAYLLLAAGEADYTQRSHDLLMHVATRGSVLALITLAERASVGHGFTAPSPAAAVLFEYLAWLTGNWTPSAGALTFTPSIARDVTYTQCVTATDLGNALAARRAIFMRRFTDETPCTLPSQSVPSIATLELMHD